MTKNFVRKIEDFVCEHCGAGVEGNGYTNHCPRCLWSKHVDKNPGDRAEGCRGMMKPVRVEMDRSEQALIHKCSSCGAQKKVKVSLQDNQDVLAQIY